MGFSNVRLALTVRLILDIPTQPPQGLLFYQLLLISGATGWNRTNIIGFSVRCMNHHCHSGYYSGAVDENRTRLNLIDSEVPSQRATTAYQDSVCR